ncbi:MAG TPA: dihydroorotate dehydrogenase electron transfer subunit [Ignavibacteriaceae bacterium]|nr:dihydroorotate dehydrogenase electron transfer subunit [Ignavibacteriaceae bacterium]
MLIINSPVEEIIEINRHIYLLKVFSPQLTSIIKPGQFLNIRVTERVYPLLRRPFSVCDVEGNHLYLMFNILGEGTNILAHKPIGSDLDILGPLGNGFNIDGDYETAVIVAGGLGAAPFPYLTRKLNGKKNILSFIGGRTKDDVITYNLKNVIEASDDGSLGFKGNVVQLLSQNLELLKSKKIKMFACGPTVMLRALKEFCIKNEFECEASTECAMACGFGICQGCPIESTTESDKYLLVCKDGPVFNIKDVVI